MISCVDVTLVTNALQFVVRDRRSRARIARLPETRMTKIEYKTILLPYRTGIFQDDSTDVAEMLNKVGVEGWRLSQIVLPSTVWGRANTMVAILERPAAN
jgi:hypothetical protein